MFVYVYCASRKLVDALVNAFFCSCLPTPFNNVRMHGSTKSTKIPRVMKPSVLSMILE